MKDTVQLLDTSNCEVCYSIVCGGCGWIAKELDVIMIQEGKMTACPLCGWKPPKITEERV